MPPKKNAPRKGAAGPSPEDQIQAAIQSFSRVLSTADKTQGCIKVPAKVLEIIKKLLKAYRAQEKSIDQDCVYEFVNLLEDDESHNLCEYLSAEAFSTTLQIILQMVDSKEAERGLYLLAASLFQSMQELGGSDDLVKRKETIGTICFGQLLHFFVDGENTYGMRRWVGLLCIQLVSSCESNHTRVEQMTEDVRRSIGRLVVEEGDEILRVIYALFVRTMTDQDTPISEMYPTEFEESAFADFPLSSQENTGWGIQFQEYLDNVFTKTSLEPPAQIGELLFTASVILTPGGQLGAKHHNNMLFVDDFQLTFLATCRDGHFDSILEIPKSSIQSIVTVPDHDSQMNAHRMAITLLGDADMVDSEDSCFLDSKAIRLTTVTFSIEFQSMKRLLEAVREGHDGIEFFSSDGSQHRSLGNSQTNRRAGLTDLGDSQTRPHNTSQVDLGVTDVGGSDENYDLPDTQQAFTGSQGPFHSQLQSAQLDDDASDPSDKEIVKETATESAMENAIETAVEDPRDDDDDEDLYSASPRNPQRKTASPETGPAAIKLAATRGRRVKPKAKRPIVPGRSSLDSQQTNAHSQMTQTGFNEANTQDQKITAGAASIGGISAKPVGSSASANRAAKKDTDAKKASGSARSSKKPTKTSAAKPIPKKAAGFRAAKLNSIASFKVDDSAYDFSDGPISSPDAKDVSTSTVLKTTASTKSSKAITKPVGKQSAPKASTATSPFAHLPKKYSIPKPTDNASKVEDKAITKSKDTKNMAVPKVAPAKSKAPASQKVTTANGKKRQSAPAAIISTRHSERAAALKAKDKMQAADDSYNEDDIEELDRDENPDDTSVNRTSKKSNSTGKLAKKAVAPPAADQTKARISGVDLAHKLADSLRAALSSDSEENGGAPTLSQTKSATVSKVEARAAVPPTNLATTKRAVAIQAVSDEVELEPSEHQFDVELDEQNPSPVEPEQTPLPIRVDKSIASSPIALVPDDLTAPFISPSVLDEGSLRNEHSPDLQETIETEQKTVVQDLPEHTITVQTSNQTQVTAKKTGENGTLKQVTVTKLQQVEVVEGSPNKRKASTEEDVKVKRRRREKEGTPETQEQIMDGEPANITMAVSKTSRRPKPRSPIPTRRSPRLANRPSRLAAAELRSASPTVTAVIKDPSRKPQVINFSSNGPQNQGMSSANKPKENSLVVEVDDEQSHEELSLPDRKRKRENANLSEIVGPPKKKQNSSPSFDNVNNENRDLVGHGSSPGPQVVMKSKPIHKQTSRRISGPNSRRPSSQGSRVDLNGSPIAAESPVDHIGKLKEILATSQVGLPSRRSGNESKIVAEAVGTQIPRQRRATEIFGPKIALGNKSKQRPSSPGEPNSRYVLHDEFQGVYTDVDTKRIVEENRVLPDPFTEGDRRSSGFIDRLQNSTSKEKPPVKSKLRINSQESNLVQTIQDDKDRFNVEKEVPKLPEETPVLNHRRHVLEPMPRPGRARRHVTEISSPSDMTSGTSYASQSSEVARTPLQELPVPNDIWNLAVRPHYSNLKLSLHRLQDEVIVKLAGEEDRMNLLVSQYEDNGTKMLDNLRKKRETQRGAINRNLEQNKVVLASVYSESRGDIMEKEQTMREDLTSDFEVNWRRNQNAIRKQIAEGRKSSEN